jgi:hypothetical protein
MARKPENDPEAADAAEDLAAAFAPAEEAAEADGEDEEGDGERASDEVVVMVDESQAHGVYCNLALVSSTETEVGIDFAFAHHQQPTAKLHARVLLSLKLARRLARSIESNLAEYERRHGAIGD